MAVPIALREDFNGAGLRKPAKRTEDAAQARRLLALAEIYDGGSRTNAARIGGVTLQIVRDWVLRFNNRGPDGLINGKAPGNRPKLNEEQRQALVRMVESGPIPAVRSPELNPVENVWQFVRDNWLSNRIFGSYQDILDHCCDAWNKLVEQPWIIMSLGLRQWAHR